MSADWLADLRAVMAEATAGPWEMRRFGIYTSREDCRQERRVVSFERVLDGLSEPQERADFAAIVALRNAWPRLEAALAQAEADRAELERLRRVESSAHEAYYQASHGNCLAAEKTLEAALRGER